MRPCVLGATYRCTCLPEAACKVVTRLQARTVQLLGRCAVQRLCSLSGAVSWDDATRRLAWSAEAQPDLAEGPQHSDQLRLTLLQEAGGGRLETDWRQRWGSSHSSARMLSPGN